MATKYDRVAADVRLKIKAGQWVAGTRIPAETDLAADYRVSLSTIRNALGLLEAEGLVDRQHGTGTFVRAERQRLRRTTDRYQWEKDRARQPLDVRSATGATEYDSGLQMGSLNFHAEYETVSADSELAHTFDIEVGTPLLRRTYLTQTEGETAPIGISVSHLVIDMIANNPALLNDANEPWPGGTIHQLSTVGIEVDRIIDTIAARPPTPQEAVTLDIRAFTPVMTLRKVSIDVAGRVVEVADITWPGDRIELSYSTALTRWPA
jgi:GntR family transcriptional regulator